MENLWSKNFSGIQFFKKLLSYVVILLSSLILPGGGTILNRFWNFQNIWDPRVNTFRTRGVSLWKLHKKHTANAIVLKAVLFSIFSWNMLCNTNIIRKKTWQWNRRKKFVFKYEFVLMPIRTVCFVCACDLFLTLFHVIFS